LTPKSPLTPSAWPCRGEIWVVNLNPTVGAEIQKSRPVVVVSSNAVGKLPIKLIAPITEWKAAFENRLWMVKIQPSPANGLSKASSVDTLQLRGVDVSRFSERIGQLLGQEMDDIAAAIAAVVEFV
jgi:mRNA interferase MazF